ncbi:MAG: MATE family efflux transporter [Planctomycetes bacterium]|nr:MATE family efflux transporter [Planctomycetota bacterium]
MDHELPAQSQRASTGRLDELRHLLALGGPIALVQIGQTSLNFVDVCFLGHFDAAGLPAMALGSTLCWAACVFCMGTLNGLDPLLSQAVGAQDRHAVPRLLWRGAVLAFLLALPAMAVLLPTATWLELLGQKPELIPGAATYARINTLGFLPFLWVMVLRALLSAHSRLRPQVLTIVVGNLANVVLDWAWIHGHLGFPAMGVAGAAWATVVVRWAMFAALLALSWQDLAPHLRAFGDATVRKAALALQPLGRLLRLGAPIGAQYALEMGVFALTAVLIGQFDQVAGDSAGGPRLGGHQIALQLASLTFMAPLGLSMAASVRVGWAVGRGDATSARRTVGVALLAGAAVMGAFMAVFLTVPHLLAAAMTGDLAIAAWAIALIPVAGVFQIGDGLQVVAIGCLRGIGDVRSPMVINVAGFWLLGLPLGCWLAYPWGRGAGPVGLWWGLAIGLFAVALLLLWMVHVRFATATARLASE